MLPVFEGPFSRHSIVAKAHLANEVSGDVFLDRRVREHIWREGEAAKTGVREYKGGLRKIQDPEVFARNERKIFRFQLKKQERMNDLRAMLEAIRNKDEVGAARYLPSDAILLRQERDGFFYEEGEEVVHLTKGMIFADLEWGRTYRFPLQQSTSRFVARKYALEYMRHELRILVGRQLNAKGMGGGSEAREQRVENLGWFAEDVVRSSLQKLAIDCFPDLRVRRADADEDALITTDLVIEIDQQQRSIVAVPSSTLPRKRFAIQLKWHERREPSPRRSLLETFHKYQKQTVLDAGITDVVEVGISLPELEYIRDAWIKKPVSGGADRYLSAEKHAELFAVVMRGILSPEELQIRCEEAKRYYERHAIA